MARSFKKFIAKTEPEKKVRNTPKELKRRVRKSDEHEIGFVDKRRKADRKALRKAEKAAAHKALKMGKKS